LVKIQENHFKKIFREITRQMKSVTNVEDSQNSHKFSSVEALHDRVKYLEEEIQVLNDFKKIENTLMEKSQACTEAWGVAARAKGEGNREEHYGEHRVREQGEARNESKPEDMVEKVRQHEDKLMKSEALVLSLQSSLKAVDTLAGGDSHHRQDRRVGAETAGSERRFKWHSMISARKRKFEPGNSGLCVAIIVFQGH
jgi:hypothetical protein